MIERINLNKTIINNGGGNSKQTPQFTGMADLVVQPLQWFEQNPMLNVSLLDVTTAIGPRTYEESQTNSFAGFEAFRRESSGLVINCLIPGVIAYGLGKLIQNPIMGANSKMGKCLTNQETLDRVTTYWNETEHIKNTEERVSATITNVIKSITGKDGHKDVKFADFEPLFNTHVETIKNNVFKDIKEYSEKEVKAASKKIIEHTHVSKNIKINGKEFDGGLESLIRDMPKILKEYVDNRKFTATEVLEHAGKAKKFINVKSLLGMGVIIPLALAAQPINRWITQKTSGQKGAPIYKDFGKNQQRELTSKEKSKLLFHKILSSAAMVGVAILSMGGKFPSMKTLQFNGWFPSMDQARLISTTTFASRIMSSQDENDRREATIRDIGTFSALYFLGDYAAKFAATVIEKINPKIQLLNHKEELKDGAGMLEKIKHWAKNTTLKTTEEAIGKAKTMRSVCQLADIGFSLALLGVIIPKITRSKTDKAREAELKKEGMDNNAIEKFYPHFMMNSTGNKNFKAFFTANGNMVNSK